MFIFMVFIGCFVSILAEDRLEVNDRCMSKTGPGICVHQDHCAELKDGFYQGTYTNDDIINCGYEVKKEIICCPLEKTEVGYRPQFYNESPVEKHLAPVPIAHGETNHAHGIQGQIRPAQKACQEITDGYSGLLTLYIIRGYPVHNGDYPHMAAIGFSTPENQAYHFLCSGSLIADRFLLTAAHCFDKPNMRAAIAVLGSTSLQDAEQRRGAIEARIKAVHLHPSYQSSSGEYDIAVVELFQGVPYSREVYPICLYTGLNYPADSTDLYVTGWGAIKTKDTEKFEVLLKAQQSIVHASECAHSVFGSQTHNSEQICAKSQQSVEEACLGDSGGPLQLLVNQENKQHQLVGINLSGFGCEVNKPGLYTPVAPHLSFIESIVWSTSLH